MTTPQKSIPRWSWWLFGLSIASALALTTHLITSYRGAGNGPPPPEAPIDQWIKSEEESAAIWVAAISGICTMIGGIVIAYLSYAGKRFAATAALQSTEANDAVNHRHSTGSPRLFDQVLAIGEHLGEVRSDIKGVIAWKNGYEGGPLDQGHKVESFVDDVRMGFRQISVKLDDVGARLDRVEDELREASS